MVSGISGYIANTDYDWYEFLSAHPEFREINFWQPISSVIPRGVSTRCQTASSCGLISTAFLTRDM